MTRPNARLARVGDELTHVLAPNVTAALEHIANELTLADSISDHTPGAGPVVALPYLEKRKCKTCAGKGWYWIYGTRLPCDDCDALGTPKTTPVEQAAFRRYEFETARDDILDAIRAIEELARFIGTKCDWAQRTRMPDKPPEKATCYADPGLTGYLVSLSDGGWHDPLCRNVSRTVKPGLCDGCRKRYERKRDELGLRPLQDDRIVSFDSEVHMVNGVAVVRGLQ